MKIYKFLSILYLKYFAIVFFSLNMFYVTVDLVFNRTLPAFANLKILVFFYSFVESLGITTSVTLVFAFILVIRKLINDNEFVSMLSFGYHKTMILKPFVFVASLIVLLLIMLNFTELAYVSEKKNTILKYKRIYNNQDNVFLKHNNAYVYFKKLLPIEKLAKDVKIFEFRDDLSLVKVHYANEAYFKDNFWILENSYTITYPKEKGFQTSKLIISNEKNIKTLEGFLPKIIHTIYEKNIQFSTPDAIKLISIFKNQNIDTNKARSVLYRNIFIPFFSIFLIVIIFSYTPTTSRLSNMTLYGFLSFTATLSTLGLFKMFEHLSYYAEGLNTEVFSLLPISVLFFYATYRYFKIS